MNVISNITSATRAALLYITVGALLIVWSSLYYVYLNNHGSPDGASWPYYVCSGFLLSGVTLLAIGLGIGWIGRSVRPAEQTHAVIPTQDNLGNPTEDVVQLPGSPLPISPVILPPVEVPPVFVHPKVAAQNVVLPSPPAVRT
jgi:hypothetical protein